MRVSEDNRYFKGLPTKKGWVIPSTEFRSKKVGGGKSGVTKRAKGMQIKGGVSRSEVTIPGGGGGGDLKYVVKSQTRRKDLKTCIL